MPKTKPIPEAQRIASAIKAAGLSQRKVALRAKVSESGLSKFLSGKRRVVTTRTIEKIDRAVASLTREGAAQ